MALKSVNEFLARISAGFGKNFVGMGNTYPNTTSTLYQNLSRCMKFQKLPSSLPSGVTSFIPTSLTLFHVSGPVGGSLLFAGVNLGTINFGTSSFTDGDTYPVVTELGTASSPTWGPIITEVTTSLNAGAGTATLTYVNQAGTTGRTVALDLQASSIAGSAALQVNYSGSDYGIRDISSVAFSGQSAPAGVVKLWGVRPLAMVYSGASSIGDHCVADLLGMDFNLMKLGINTEILLFSFATSGKSAISELYIVGDN